MAPNPDYVYCTICGLVLDGETIVLAGPHWPTCNDTSLDTQAPDQEIIRYTAEVDFYPGKLFLLPDREQVYLQHPYDLDEQSHNKAGRMYMGIHAACNNLVNRAIESPIAKLASIDELWFTLERRCASYISYRLQQRPRPTDMNYVPPIPNDPSGQITSLGFERYYVPYCCIEYWGGEWEGWWNEDPIVIPDLTSRLLSNLERLDKSSVETSTGALPEDIKDHAHTYFYDIQFSLQNNRKISQSSWKEIFVQIPFLWDLDIEAVNSKTGSNMKDIENWNWEKLTRKVMSSPHPSPRDASNHNADGIWSYDDVGLHVPGGFTNRRRIWQILEDM
ncbi:hypothetical protein FGRMN_7787 [Fusarium graminum]|nr:hypothetical protein FGRMN_7787 [Fusarium graminum]